LFEGRVYATSDWSLSGFAVSDYAGALSPGSLFTVEAAGLDAEAMTPVAIRSRVVRTSADRRRLVASFLVIDAQAYALMQRLVDERTKLYGAPKTP
jgi:hypothetical protein